MVRVLCASLLVLSALVYGSAVAHAQTDEARDAFRQGAARYAERDYEGALEAFERSYEIAPVPVVLFNLAQTLRQLGRLGQAVAAFERYLETETRLTRRRRVEVEQTLAELRAITAELTVQVSPPGAEVRLDSYRVGEAPLGRPLVLGEGSHTLEVSRPGYVTVRRIVAVTAGEPQTVTFTLTPETAEGTLRVSASVAGARVEVDGRDMGETPLALTLGEGAHRVSVLASGHRPFHERLTLGALEERELFADLVPRTGAGSVWLWTALGGAVVVATVLAVILVARGASDDGVLDGTLGTVAALR